MQIYKSSYDVFRLCVILMALHSCLGDYHCRRKNFGCKNGGLCNRDGTCACPETHTGFDCSLEKAVVNCEQNPCKNDGICYDKDRCLCSPDYYGAKCELKTVSSDCLGTEIKMTFTVPAAFSGSVYLRDADDSCTFAKAENEIDGYNTYSLTIPFGSADNPCSSHINQTDDFPQSGDTSRSADVIVSYNSLLVSNTDSLIVYNCIHKGSNFTMFAELDDVGLDEIANLKKDIQTTTYLPVRFVVTDKDNQPLDKPLYVGDIFKLLFYLVDTNVYESIIIDYCVANNTKAQGMVQFDFIKNGCPTDDGRNILVTTEGPVASEYSRPGSTEKMPASELLMYAFKFKGTTNVGFNCAVRICKKGDEQFCQQKSCSGPKTLENNGTTPNNDGTPEVTSAMTSTMSTTTSITPVSTNETSAETVIVTSSSENETSVADSRRKRSSGERQFLSTILTVQEPPLNEVLILPSKTTKIDTEDDDEDNNRPECSLTQEVLIVIVVMATLVFVLLVFTCILVVSIYRSKRREQLFKEKHSLDFHYTIPRPKVTE